MTFCLCAHQHVRVLQQLNRPSRLIRETQSNILQGTQRTNLLSDKNALCFKDTYSLSWGAWAQPILTCARTRFHKHTFTDIDEHECLANLLWPLTWDANKSRHDDSPRDLAESTAEMLRPCGTKRRHSDRRKVWARGLNSGWKESSEATPH